MGFFAVVSETHPHGFTVSKLDINLWCLPGLFSRFVLTCDVGIKLNATSAPLSAFHLALPFGTDQNDLEDLSSRLEDTRTAGLVFGEPTSLHRTGSSSVLSYGTEQLLLGRIEINASRLESGQSSANFSLWRLQLAAPIPAAQAAYLRLRLPVRRLGRVWNWIPSRFSKRGAVVDVRVSDLRESVAIRGGHDYSTKIVPVDQLNVFIIVPAHLQTHRQSPDLRYARVLEGQVWEPYLGRATDLRRRGKFIVNFWRATDVRSEREFRGSLSLLTVGDRLWLRIFAWSTLGCGLAIALLTDRGVLRHSVAGEVGIWLTAFGLAHLKALTFSAVAALALKFLPQIPSIRRRTVALRRQLWTVERWIYTKRAGV